MAGLNREKNGTYSATWRNAEGRRVSIATGETILERATKKAAALESEARFWEDHQDGTWQRLADAGFSPRYLHNIFTCARHVPFPTFRKLLAEGDVKFKPPAAWRDRAKPKGPTSAKRWSFRGSMLTLEELMSHAGEGITRAALRFRLDSRWDIETALTTELMSRSEAGTRGANATNTRP